MAITVTSIHTGSLDDFKGISVSGIGKDKTPSYVTLRMTNLSHHTLKSNSNNVQDPAASIGVIEGNNIDTDIILTGYFHLCPQTDTPNPLGSGQTFTTCQVFFERGPVTEVAYNGSDATYSDPIIWTP